MGNKNKVEQKQVIQMIGEWGYTPSELEKLAEERKELARRYDDPVGMTVYTSLIALGRFAQTGDPKLAVGGNNAADKLVNAALADFLRDKNIQDIGGLPIEESIRVMRGDKYADEVLTSLYNTCAGVSTFQDADLALRESVMLTVAPLIIGHIKKECVEIMQNLIGMLVGADNHAMLDGNLDNVHRILEEHSLTLLDFTTEVSKFTDAIEKCKDVRHSGLGQLMAEIIGDVGATIQEASQNILSILDNSPEVWTSYAVAFGRLMSSFMLALSFGYVPYDDYKDMMDKFHQGVAASNAGSKPAKKDSDASELQRLVFGRN